MNTQLQTSSNKTTAYIALWVVYLVWGTTLGAIHIGIQTMPPAFMACLRFGLSGLLLIGFCLLRGEGLPKKESLTREFLVGTFLFCLSNGLSFWVLRYLPTGMTGILMATSPFWMNLLASVIPPREKIKPAAVYGIALGFVGMVVLLWPKLHTQGELTWAVVLSLLLGLAVAVNWAIGSTIVRRTRTTSSVFMSIGVQNLFAALVMSPLLFATVPLAEVQFTWPAVLALAYLVIFGTIIGTYCYYMTLERLPMPVASTFAYVTPIITLIVGVIFFQEELNAAMILGTAVILVGVVLTQIASFKQNSSETKNSDCSVTSIYTHSTSAEHKEVSRQCR